jgi:hypothetical protein
LHGGIDPHPCGRTYLRVASSPVSVVAGLHLRLLLPADGHCEIFLPPWMRSTQLLRWEAVSARLRCVSDNEAHGAAVDVGAAAHTITLILLGRTKSSGILLLAVAHEIHIHRVRLGP